MAWRTSTGLHKKLVLRGCSVAIPLCKTPYQSGDPYLRFAQQAGAVPPTATKASHGALRDLYKTVMLGTNYGLSEVGLATRLQLSRLEARDS